MLIAIDESGSFRPGSTDHCFFIAVHLRQRRTLFKPKERQFLEWERSLPKTLKNPKGEIKSSSLSDSQLYDFAKSVLCSSPFVGITPFTIRPSENPGLIIEKHRRVTLIGIQEGVKEYARLGKPKLASVYNDFGHWFKKLHYSQFLKITILGRCIYGSIVNAVGHSITGGYDRDELPRLKLLIDQDFIKEPRPNTFWHELLRNQIYQASKADPIPLLKKWEVKGHPFLDKYLHNDRLNLNQLFWKHCAFVLSHQHFEIRIADAINAIVFRRFNHRKCREAYAIVRQCFLQNGRIKKSVLGDFDLEGWNYDPNDNPWRIPP